MGLRRLPSLLGVLFSERRGRRPSVRNQITSYDSLSIYQIEFDIPFSNNDRNFFAQSVFFNHICRYCWSSVRPTRCVAVYQVNRIYWIPDSFFPKLLFFTISSKTKGLGRSGITHSILVQVGEPFNVSSGSWFQLSIFYFSFLLKNLKEMKKNWRHSPTFTKWLKIK